MLKPNSKLVYEYVKANEDANITATDIAEGTQLGVKTVNGIVTSAFCKKELMERVEAEIEVEDAEGKVTHKAVKFIKLTDKGRAFDPDAEDKAE